ncbi:MAG: pyruvate kinase [Gammaproteobacteria bacterium]|jgi:pyruvate kinase|nr:pyruvate kinase [Gammaproteobacteria bacterium]
MNPSINKTKIVCTIGPASDSVETLEKLLKAGMNVARLNFSHGDFSGHEQVIKNIRLASKSTGIRIAIMADLPGPKIRIGILEQEPIELSEGNQIVLTTDDIIGNASRVSVSFDKLPQVVNAGDTLFINDGLIQLNVVGVKNQDIICKVIVGGELRSRKGLNLPGIELGISAFTEHDRACLKFALEHGVDAVSQSFVASAADIDAVRQYAQEAGRVPFIIAKIERKQALENIDEILRATDGIMVARGDLGVEIPIEEIAVTQKQLMQKANKYGTPVITATHMLESMVEHRRPTRAEATDVANAILDGTDSVMLSGESAMGKYPVQATAMLAKIAMATEPNRPQYRTRQSLRQDSETRDQANVVELIALSVQYTLDRIQPAAILVPTLSGSTVRNITRFRLPVWITAFSPNEATCQTLQFSYGINPVLVEQDLPDWDAFCKQWLKSQGITSGLALLTQGPSELNPGGNHRMEILELH